MFSSKGFSLVTWTYLVAIFTVGVQLCVGAYAGVSSPGQARSEEAQVVATGIQRSLETILKEINQNHRPEQTLLESSQKMLEANKETALAFDKDQRIAYMLLQSWTDFYLIPPKDCSLWAAKAYKLDAANNDAWASQALLSMFKGKKAVVPGSQDSKSKRGRNRRDSYDYGADSAYGTPDRTENGQSGDLQEGLLDFSPEMVRAGMTGRRYSQLKLLAATGEKVFFDAGKRDVLCLLLWRGDDSSGGKYSLQQQRDYFENMYRILKDQPNVKFAQINTDVPEVQRVNSSYSQRSSNRRNKGKGRNNGYNQYDPVRQQQEQIRSEREAMDAFLKSLPSYEEFPYPTIVAAAPRSGGKVFADIKEEQPFLMIINQNGKVNYAGVAAGFAPAFVLTTLTDIELPLTQMELPAAHSSYTGRADGWSEPNKPVAEPNRPAMAIQPAKRPVSRPPLDPPTLSIEDQLRAENLLRSAELHINGSRKLRGKNPKQGIEDARQVIRKYPGTEYAQQALELLRRVPDRLKAQHNITEEELGY